MSIPRLFPSAERYMQPEDIARIDRLLKEVLWMCDVVINTGTQDEHWNRFFKGKQYHFAVMSMFTYIRDFVRSLLDRESSDAKHPIFSRHRLKVRLVRSPCPVPPSNRGADICETTHTMHLYPLFTDGWREGHGLAWKELQINVAVAGSWSDTNSVFQTRAGCLLHELIHYVSFLKWDDFCRALYCREAKSYAAAYLMRLIKDQDPSIWAWPKDNADQETLRGFKATEDEIRKGNVKEHHLAYGVWAAERLAAFKRGAIAAIFNDDNYGAFAAAHCADYLQDELVKGSTTNEALSRRPLPRLPPIPRLSW